MVSPAIFEKALFSKGYYQDIYNYLSTSEETVNLVGALDYLDFKRYVKKDASMLLLQMLVVNYFSTEHMLYNPQKNWRIPYEHRLSAFLQDAYSTCSEYPDVLDVNDNPFLKVKSLTLTPIGYKVLELSNLFFTELYRDTKKIFMDYNVLDAWSTLFAEVNSPVMKKYYKIFIDIFQVLFREGCPKKAVECSDLFSPYSGVEGYEERHEHYAQTKMQTFIGNLLIFSYTCNNGWITPRVSKKGLIKPNSKAEVLRLMYNGELVYCPSSDGIQCVIEKVLPDLTYRLSKLNNPEGLDKITENKVSYKYPIPEGFKEAHAKYYNKGITMREFSRVFHVSDTKIREWMKECNLPVRPRGAKKGKSVLDVQNEQKPTVQEFSVEPTVQVLPVEKPTFSFNLFGYKFSFTAKKEKPPKSVNIADEFPDEIEY